MELPNFRMCKQAFPQVGDLVYTEITAVTNTGADCTLLEYEGLTAYLDINEWTRRRVKTVTKFTSVGSRFVMQVVRVDESRGYIDVAKKNVTTEESTQHLAHFKKSATLHNVFQRLSMLSGLTMQTIYEEFGWPLYTNFAHPLDALMEAARNQEVLRAEYQHLDRRERGAGAPLEPLTGEKKEGTTTTMAPEGEEPTPLTTRLETMRPSQHLQRLIEHRFPVEVVRVTGKFSLMSPGPEGIQAIKAVLIEAKQHIIEKYGCELEVTVEACPIYCVAIKSTNPQLAIEIVNAYMHQVRKGRVRPFETPGSEADVLVFEEKEKASVN
jgi:translation initiation factor 2 alpha subunit (eIF-2alpha)